MINELSFIKPHEKIGGLSIPVLTIHGDQDSVVPFEIAKKYCSTNNQRLFVTIKGADHGFTNPDDDDFTHPDTIRFRKVVFEKVLKWINKNGK